MFVCLLVCWFVGLSAFYRPHDICPLPNAGGGQEPDRVRHGRLVIYIYAQSADSTVSSFVDSSAQHRGMRPNLIAMKNKNSQSQI